MDLYMKKILIIGGTGTIGKSLITRILQDNPSVIRVFSRDEFKQFEMQQQYREYTNLRFLIGDVRDLTRLKRAMEGIDYVFHAAAMKHVPACEYNPFEAVQTNILGTQNVIQAALDTNVKKVIFTSTDKAIAPTNTYGASKLMAERLISAAQYQVGSKSTVFAAVRFGNVMGSRGSVIPLFQKQIVQHRLMTITSKQMSRFMMTQEDATNLVLKAAEQAQGGETFVLKMPVINLEDLAEVVLEHTCLTQNIPIDCVNVQEIGIRPGEKLYEELMSVEEAEHAWELNEMYVIPSTFLSKQNYPNAVRAQKRAYSSKDYDSISKNELKNMLLNNNLLSVVDSVNEGIR